MPIYSFQCEQCGTVFDVYASIQEKETGLQPRCPRCQARQVIAAGLLVHGGAKLAPSSAGCGPNAGPGCCR